MAGKNFKSKLYVKIVVTEGQFLLSPIQDINPTLNTPNTPIHSLEADNVGVFKGNDTFPFTLTVIAVRDEESGTNPAKLLSRIAARHQSFQVIMTERQTLASDGKNWAFDTLVLNECYVNTGSPSRSVVNGQPVATFNCISLGVEMDGEFYNGTIPTTP